MLCKACEKHAEHDRGDVADMFSCGRKANDRKDSADCRSVQFTSDSENKDCGKETVDGHVEDRCRSPVVPEIIGSADSGAGQDIPVGRADLLPSKEKRREDHDSKEAAEDSKEQLVVAFRPDQAGLSGDAEGLQHGDHDGGDDPGGKTYIIEGVSFVGIMNMGG